MDYDNRIVERKWDIPDADFDELVPAPKPTAPTDGGRTR